jgi:biotin operon repressor
MAAAEPLGDRATRLIEILVTHNEAVSRDDLACALGMSADEVWALAQALQAHGEVTLDEADQSVVATPRA